jgi:hypothetical protein
MNQFREIQAAVPFPVWSDQPRSFKLEEDEPEETLWIDKLKKEQLSREEARQSAEKRNKKSDELQREDRKPGTN